MGWRLRPKMPPMAKGKEKRTHRLSMRLPESLHKRLRTASETDRRTMADFAIIAIERALDEFEAEQAARVAKRGK